MKKISLFIFTLLSLGIFNVDAQYKLLHSFNGTNGNYPEGDVVAVGNKLFGMAQYGGAHGFGCVFTIDTTGASFKDLLDFDSLNGQYPFGNLIYASGILYGMAPWGGANGIGLIFSIDTTGAGYRDLYDFNGPNGALPIGSLTLYGNKFFGMTAAGGPVDSGLVFSIDTNGAGYKVILYFDSINKCGTPMGSVIISGGTIYGMSEYGGLGWGNVFSVDTSGSGFKNLFSFNHTDGGWPTDALTLSGNTLYGSTWYGGVDSLGNLFSIHTDGSNFKDMFDFTYPTGNYPYGSLTLFGGRLYGMADDWTYNGSTIFSIDTDGAGFSNLYNFKGTNDGTWPSGALTLAAGVFYGMNASGGIYDSGAVFSYKPSCNFYNEPICIATIDTATNKAEVIWGRTNSPPQGGHGSYNIYRDSSSTYNLVHNQPLNVLSEFIDTGSNPSAGPVSYEISTVDSCGESALSLPHSTIYLATASSLNAYNLWWTPYVGFTPVLYRIFRGPNLNAMTEIDSVPNTVYTYVDSFPPINSYYAVEAVSPYGVYVPTARVVKGKITSATLSGSFSNGFNTAILGVNTINSALANVKIYPNPSNGKFHVICHSERSEESQSITVYNVLGEIVFTEILPPNTRGQDDKVIDLSSQPAGIYTLRVQTENGTVVKKLVKMK